MTDTDTYIRQLKESNPLREPTLREAIRALHLPPGAGAWMQDVELAFRPYYWQRQ